MIIGAQHIAQLKFSNPYMLVKGKMETVLPEFPDNCIDACVTDPPYNLGFMGKEWDKHKTPLDFQLWFQDKASHIFRVLKPGAYFICFGGTRTYHRMTSAIEDAGFEIRDCIMWLYGSGFPKSHNGEWGGTALKPAYEPIIIARKPIEGTVKQNFEKWGTGGIDIDAGRIPGEPWKWGTQTDLKGGNYGSNRPSEGDVFRKDVEGGENGRWPANVIHDGSEEVVALFPQSNGQQGDVKGTEPSNTGGEGTNCFGKFNRVASRPKRNDKGSAARFFYCAKTSREDRNEGCEALEAKPSGMVSNTSGQHMTRRDGYQPPQSQNNHPTVKPTDIMRYLVKMFVPKGGICIDPFTGSGSTGKGCMYEFIRYVGIEMDFDLEIARERMEFAIANRDLQTKIFE